jgi:hypothetical protein
LALKRLYFWRSSLLCCFFSYSTWSLKHLFQGDLFNSVNYKNNFVVDGECKFVHCNNEILNADITAEELLKAVKSLKNKKSCCSDCITNEMIKVSCTLYYNLYVDIFNLILIIYIHKVIEIVVPFLWSNYYNLVYYFLSNYHKFSKILLVFFRNFQHIIKQFGSKTSIFLTEQFIMLLFLI